MADTVVQLAGAGTYTVPDGKAISRAVIIAGGGGGGSNQGGGGGAGGVIDLTDPGYSAGDMIAYSIGNGGNGGPNNSRGIGANGQNTTFGVHTAVGGGYGSGNTGVPGGSGGSGGGGDGAVSPYSSGGAGTAGQGNQGGTKIAGTPGAGLGFPGGGGAGSAGGMFGNGNTAAQIAKAAETGASVNTVGGVGVYYGDIFGDDKGDSGWFAGGGSGLGCKRMPGGAAGGGTPDEAPGAAAAGIATTGGGGGAGQPTFGIRQGGAGGSGTILLLLTTLGPELSPLSDDSIEVGTEITLTSSVLSSVGAVSLQWLLDDVAIPGANGLSLTVTPQATGVYTLEGTDDNGSSSVSATITVSLPANEIDTDLPATTNVTAHTSTQLVVLASRPTNAYQWTRGGVDIPGETSPTYRFTPTLADQGVVISCSSVDEYGQIVQFGDTTLNVQTANDLNDFGDPVNSNPVIAPTNVTYTRQDHASIVLTLEGQVTIEDDYRFSDKTFTRRDRTVNPRGEE